MIQQCPASLLSLPAKNWYGASIAATIIACTLTWLGAQIWAWNHIKGRLYEAHETTHQIRRVSRQESASPATGVLAIHQAEQRDLFDSALDFD